MEVISIVRAVFFVANSILERIEQQETKQQTITDLRQTIATLRSILFPFTTLSLSSDPQKMTSHTMINSTALPALLATAEALKSAEDHLSLWTEKPSKFSAVSKVLTFLNPASVIKQLQDDQQRLFMRVMFLSAAIQLSSDRSPGQGSTTNQGVQSALAGVQNAEVKLFWTQRIGQYVACCPSQTFCWALATWMGVPLPGRLCNTLLLLLDEYAIGGITPSSLDRFVGTKRISESVARLSTDQTSPPPYEALCSIWPTIVWIDDFPENNVLERSFAERQGIEVICLLSTASAKAWVEANEERLRRLDEAHLLSFISDNHRFESPESQAGTDFLNLSAGETMLRYLRGRRYLAPVLILCDYKSILKTLYVLSYGKAGSTVSRGVCEAFISQLGKKGVDVVLGLNMY
ncbi:hypothetical protein JAAARDRAFT_63247 [Jaapia argillacea MUCL 33604]|uniref:Uncharacterized protein n=1 Tax=Jaapia argillacea MUCL 33604 TaxID=933084 RepID=A0A067P640_9AGAM|nr:hypothetical protein JAAARDRAFT_63247 [Jaapia argillacea MUCL 33604]